MASCPFAGSPVSLCRLGLLITTLGLSAGFLFTRTGGLRSADSPPPPAQQALYGKTEAARNPEQLTLVTDERKVVGWISGAKDHAGAEVLVRNGKKSDKVKVEPGNVFSWDYQVTKPTRLELSLGDLKQIVTVQPRDKRPVATVFFLADRHVYRPGQTLHFVGFLRQLDEQGNFTPLIKRNVEVVLKNQRQGNVVYRCKVTSDELGRFTGDYKFVAPDQRYVEPNSLGQYQLSIADFKGNLVLDLADYRKPKTQLEIKAEQQGNHVTLKFAAVDWMNRPAPAKKVTFTAQVVRNPVLSSRGSLRGEEFAYSTNKAALTPRMEDLSEEDQLLLRGDPQFDPAWVELRTAYSQVPTTVVMISGEVNLTGKSMGEYKLEVPPECRQPGHAVIVQATVLDAAGREEHQSDTIPLAFLSAKLKLTLSRPIYDVDEPIQVKMTTPDGKKVDGSATLVAMRLAQVPTPFWGGFGGMMGNMDGLNLGMGGGLTGQPRQGFGFTGLGNRVGNPNAWMAMALPETVKRTLVTATAFKDATATLKLSQAGAYKLVAIVERPDGGKWQQEIACLVQPATERTGVSLRLTQRSYKSGEALTGTLLSRFTNARVLLTVRDSQGLRLFKTLTTDKNGLAEIKEKLPADVRYGCVITAQYSNSTDLCDFHLATQTFHVEPTDRLLQIETKTKAVYGPGEKVTLDFQVNRKEPVDLIVSVYDQALKNINPAQVPDIASYYLADERGFDSQGRDVLERCLAGATIESLLQKARKIQKELAKPNAEEESDITPYSSLLEDAGRKQFDIEDIRTLLELAGVNARLGSTPDHVGLLWKRPGNRNATLMELLNTQVDNHRIHIGLLHDTFYFSAYDVTQPIVGGFNFNPRWFGPMFGIMGGGMGGMLGGGFQAGALGGGALGALGGALGVLGGALGALGGLPQPAIPQPKQLGPDRDQKNLVIRRDFADSAYWNAQVRTDAEGKARVEFKVPDSLTAWQVQVTAVTTNMHVGQGTASFQVSKPIMIDPILPRVFTQGDKVKVAANVINRGKEKQTLRVRLKTRNGELLDRPQTEITLEAGGSQFVFWTFLAGSPGFSELLFSVEGPADSDASLKRMPVVGTGVEETTTKSGFCKQPATIEIPRGVDPAQAQLEIRLAPTLMADLVDTLDYLVDYPYGCAEQTMSRFLPAIKVAQVLQHFELEHAGLKKKLPLCVEGGIKRLLELQQADGGWGWNGSSAVHEMMTPYVLYGLLQAEKAGYRINSDQALDKGLNRVGKFVEELKDQRFTTDRIFCMYVYGLRHPIKAEWWQFIEEHAKKALLSDEAIALALQMAVQHKSKELAPVLANLLHKRAVQEQELVFWKTAGFSRWQDDPLEITATVLKALVMYDAGDALIPGVLAYFNSNKHGNRWHSTKDTAMIVEALCDYMARQKLNPADKPRLMVTINDGPAREISFDTRAMVFKVFVPSKELREGSNKIGFPEGTGGVMYRLILRHTVRGSEIPSKNQGLSVRREYWLLDDSGKRIKEVACDATIPRGSFVECVTTAARTGVQEMRYVLLENPRPACCEFVPEDDPRFNQSSTPYVLREERETHLACHYELTPMRLENRCVLLAEIPGEYVVPPAQVELMYQPEIRGHSGTFRFKVAER